MLGGEEPAQELMLSGQLLQQLTVLRGRNVAEFVLAVLIVEVADDDQLAGHVLAGNQAKEPRVHRLDAFEHPADLGVKCQASLTQTNLPTVKYRNRRRCSLCSHTKNSSPMPQWAATVAAGTVPLLMLK
jgi:hypothetical protein